MSGDVVGEGFSPTDLITAADTVDGKVVFDEADQSLIETMEETKVEFEEPKKEVVITDDLAQIVEVEEVVEEEKPQFAELFNEEVEHRTPKDTETLCDLGDFRPTIVLMGTGRGFYNCP